MKPRANPDEKVMKITGDLRINQIEVCILVSQPKAGVEPIVSVNHI